MIFTRSLSLFIEIGNIFLLENLPARSSRRSARAFINKIPNALQSFEKGHKQDNEYKCAIMNI